MGSMSAPEVISALGRAGFGAAADDIAMVTARGFPAWVEEQLAPREEDDHAALDRLARLRLRIRYNATPKYQGIDEMRPLTYLAAPIDAAWPLILKRADMDGAERRRPRDEVTAATILRAVHGRWQLREVMASFWHDHFNVDAYAADEISVALASFDREVIRRFALGNFR